MARQVEARLVNEFLFERFREKLQWKRVRLGPVPDKAMARAFMVTLRWADAIVKNNGELIVIEAKIFPEFGGLGQLESYAKLVSRTPEFQEFRGLPIRLLYLTTREDVNVREDAEEKNIEYVVFRPDWVEAYERERFKAPPLE